MFTLQHRADYEEQHRTSQMAVIHHQNIVYTSFSSCDPSSKKGIVESARHMSIITKYPILTNYIYLGGIVQYAAAPSIVCVSFCINLRKFCYGKYQQ